MIESFKYHLILNNKHGRSNLLEYIKRPDYWKWCSTFVWNGSKLSKRT